MSNRMEDLTGVALVAESGRKYKLIKQVGSGAQGVVYEESGNKYMVKYFTMILKEIRPPIIVFLNAHKRGVATWIILYLFFSTLISL